MTKSLPKSVNICECWARDGLQGEANFIPTEQKIRMIDIFAEVGFKRIEVTSFSHPKLIKQFSDTLEVIKGISRKPGVTYIGLIPNERGLDRLLDAQQKGSGLDEIIVVISASEAHCLANIERTHVQALSELDRIIKRGLEAGLKINACIGTVFGCPLTGQVPVEKVIEFTQWYLDKGAHYIMLGDTTGEANPLQVKELYSTMLDRFPGANFIAHFHDTRGAGIANAIAALEMGITMHDSSFGGIGGQPPTTRPRYHRGLTGNTATEDLVCLFDEMGVDTGLNLERVLETASLVEEICGRELWGKVTRGAGRTRRMRDEELLYEDLKVGKQFPPTFFYVTPEIVKGFAEAVDDHSPLYLDRQFANKSEFSGLIAPPALSAIFMRKSYIGEKKMPPGGILAKQEIESLKPLRPGDILITNATVIEKYERKGRNYVVIGTETVKPNGEKLIKGKITAIWPK